MRQRWPQTLLAVAAGVLVLVLVPGLVQRASAQSVLHVGNPGAPASLDPHRITGVWENRIVGDMFVGLTTEAPDGSIAPGAAERWSVTDDGLEYVFHLREQAWSDGRPLTARDFEYSFKRMLAPETAAPYADFFYMIEGARAYARGEGEAEQVGVSALDERTLRIRLTRPTGYFPGLLMHFAAMPVPGHVVEQAGREWTSADNIVVNGPFTLEERVPNAHVALRANPLFYAADTVALDGVVFHVQEDREGLVRRFRTGELHVVRDFPSGRAAWLRDNVGESTVRTEPFLGLTFIAVNHRHGVLQQREVRAALSLALEREVIAQRLLGSGEQPAFSLVPPATEHYDEPARFDWRDQPREQRLERARELLESAGYGRDRPLALQLRYRNSENDRRTAVAAQAMWREAGVDVELVTAETAVHYARLQSGDFDLGLASWLAVYDDAQTFTLLLESETGANNFGAYRNAEYDRLAQAAAGTVSQTERAALLQAAERIALDDHGLIPVYHHASRNLVSPSVGGWVANNLDVHRSRYLSLD